jgi:phosphomevalonate kinase
VTRARAPGKVVLSGAYAVLSGAPAIVSAVSRYVTADASRPADFVTDEVRAALGAGERAPWFDASELRQGDRKLGLGSSAAILVASLFALERARDGERPLLELRQAVFERALAAHRAAQGGGSGVDVASSTFGGTLVYQLHDAAPRLTPITLPGELTVEIWACPSSASTRELIARVDALRTTDAAAHQRYLGAQAAASREAATAAERDDAAALLAALRAQHDALLGLGRAAAAPIVTSELAELDPEARSEGGVLLPAGAGGGDIALFVGRAASSAGLRAALRGLAHELLPTDMSAEGVAEA